MSASEPHFIKRIALQVNSDLNASSQVLSWFEAINQPPLPDQRVWWQCQTILKEGFDNAVRYAHGNLSQTTPIKLEATRSRQFIEILIWDHGPAFDLNHKLASMPELEENFGERGRGLKIMERIADHLSYDRIDGCRNCLRILKRYNVNQT